jgi:hypothetical protein
MGTFIKGQSCADLYEQSKKMGKSLEKVYNAFVSLKVGITTTLFCFDAKASRTNHFVYLLGTAYLLCVHQPLVKLSPGRLRLYFAPLDQAAHLEVTFELNFIDLSASQ